MAQRDLTAVAGEELNAAFIAVMPVERMAGDPFVGGTVARALFGNRGDAIIASMSVTPALRARLDFTDPYYRAPARFVSRRDAVMPEVRPEYLEGKKVGVIAGTSHEAYLKAMFTDAEIKSYPNDDALRLALRRSEVDFIFGDAISLAFWINGTDSGECCAFSGGPFVESRYFGEGIGIAVRKGNDLLRTSLNWAEMYPLGCCW